MTTTEITILSCYFAVLVVLAIYGLHRYVLMYLYFKYKDRVPVPQGCFAEPPLVTVQLPIFNEMYVVTRLIEAVCRMDYPRDRLEIQVLDDSTDETQQIAQAAVERYRAQGYDIHYLHRPDRLGFKAGALDFGMQRARGEFLAIFDADFVPAPEILRCTIDYFTDPQVGMVQVRWGHINRDFSILTQVQSIFLDGHFVLEHGARNRSGRFFNFNGTAGVWRRSCIGASGGWQHDTLTEDLDLSYRAQLKGWHFVFLPHIVSPAELPVEMNAFKTQQHRWAKGSIQTGKKLIPALLRSRLPWTVKLEALFHLTNNAAYLLMIALSLLMFPAMAIRVKMGWSKTLIIDLPIFLLASASFSSFYFCAQREIYADWKKRLKYIPFLMSLGMGLSVNNAKAVLEALLGFDTEFRRTPKYRIESNRDQWKDKRYRGQIDMLVLIELALGIYFSVTLYFAIVSGLYFSIPFIILFQVGFLYTAMLSLLQLGHRWRFERRQAASSRA
jgi:cellulose synthase/poly-beta-1,6-N-acetylglucosamine synthase-like glycosyltransferase